MIERDAVVGEKLGNGAKITVIASGIEIPQGKTVAAGSMIDRSNADKL